MLAAAIPGAFPPVLLEAEHDGQRFQEMRVDGGAAVQVFLNPPGVRLYGGEARRTVWVVRNGRMDAQVPENIPRGLFTITARSAQTLLAAGGWEPRARWDDSAGQFLLGLAEACAARSDP